MRKIIEQIEKILDEKYWVADVKTKWTPPEGFFKQSADKIASGLISASDSIKQAISRLNFYKNRSGKNLSDAEIKTLDDAMDKLSKMVEK